MRGRFPTGDSRDLPTAAAIARWCGALLSASSGDWLLEGLSWVDGDDFATETQNPLHFLIHAAVGDGDKRAAALAGFLRVLSAPTVAESEEARDLMEAGQFEEARLALWPAARSGNADAEELIGVMYALGLGVELDYTRAFEWYLRASLKGHPGAQSGIGWYYEVGLGMPAPDLVRAYMWYALSTIGGDPDAAISVDEVRKKMTAEQIEKAHVLIDDYRVWMYPFR